MGRGSPVLQQQYCDDHTSEGKNRYHQHYYHCDSNSGPQYSVRIGLLEICLHTVIKVNKIQHICHTKNGPNKAK